MSRSLVLVANNVRSCYNVGSLLRTADGLGVKRIFLTGYTPYPAQVGDQRLPHLREKINRQIAKTALGAEKAVDCEYVPNLEDALVKLRKLGFQIVALEQSPASQPLSDFKASPKVALLVGSERSGLLPTELKMADAVIEIPMHGQKESFNVTVAAAIALFEMQK